MSAIKLPEPGLLATFVNSMSITKESPCGTGNIDGTCNTSMAVVSYVMNIAGSNFLKIYNGPKCKHGYPTSAGNMAYMLDNYAMHAIKGPCTPDWQTLLRGSVALLMYHKLWGENVHAFDVWVSNKCAFYPELMTQGTAKELWIWPIGKSPKLASAKKPQHHHAKHKVAIF